MLTIEQTGGYIVGIL